VHGFAPQRILVVGPSYETRMLREELPEATVDTLGWYDDRFPLREGEQHVELDLNDADRPPLEPHDVVICSEVIEHLQVAPVPVLRYLGDALADDGRLILQTPNAASLPNRLRLLLGRNPYEAIREEPRNPGHFHEYTVSELRDAVTAAGLEVERVFTANYFDHGSRKNRAYRAAGRVLPGTLREGITMIARRGR
jgi:SAM-dependent methyltransferase